jgi:hypothetical protein
MRCELRCLRATTVRYGIQMHLLRDEAIVEHPKFRHFLERKADKWAS